MRVAAVLVVLLVLVVAAFDQDSQDSSAPVWDADAVVAPDVLIAEPVSTIPGTAVSLRFVDGRGRGIHFVLETMDGGDAPSLVAHLVSDWGGEQEPGTYPPVREVHFAAIGIDGERPDVVALPDDVPPGDYRICTGSTSPNICTPLTIVSAP